jgi:DNA-binding beta-propeller fold protein YncE
MVHHKGISPAGMKAMLIVFLLFHSGQNQKLKAGCAGFDSLRGLPIYRDKKNFKARWRTLEYLRKFIFPVVFGIMLVSGIGVGIASAHYDFFFSWGSSGTEAGQLDLPRGISLDPAGNVYVIDQANNRTQVFSGDGEFLREWGSFGEGDGQFNVPFGILVDKGRVYVTDRKNNRVQVFSQNGTYRTQWETREAMPGVPFQPVAICVNSSGYFFVGGIGGIQVFSPKMNYVTTWGSFGDGDDQFQVPFGLAVNATGYLYAADTLNCRIQVLSPDGRFVDRFGEQGGGPGQFFFPTGLAIDDEDCIFVADSNNDRVQVFYPSGTFRMEWGSRGSDPGQFEFVTGIAVKTPDTDTRPVPELIYTTDLENDRVQVFVMEETPVIRDADPASGKSGAKSQILRITGSGYLVGCTVRLEKSGSPAITARIRGVPLADRIISTLNLAGAARGSWDIVVVNPGGAEGRLRNGFVVR